MKSLQIFILTIAPFVSGGSGYAQAPAKKGEPAPKAATPAPGSTAAPTGKSPAATVTLDELRKIQGNVKNLNHLTVSFDQSQYRALRKRERTSSGRARFSKPDKFYWALENPMQDAWVYDGKQLYNYSADLKSAVKYNLSGPKARSVTKIVDLVMNLDSLLKRYDMVEARREGDVVKVELAPKTKSDVTAVDLHISESQNYISYIKLYFPGGNHTVLNFKSPNRSPIPASVYSLPKGVKITESN